jgi:hypothetical protein
VARQELGAAPLADPEPKIKPGGVTLSSGNSRAENYTSSSPPMFACADAELGKLPSEKALEGVEVFSVAEQDENPPSSLVARLMSELKGKGEQPSASHSMCATGEELPALPNKCVDKILAGEFIAFADLPPRKRESEG